MRRGLYFPRMPGFERRGDALVCDGVSLEQAAAEHGTPLYVYSRAAVEEAYAAYDRAFASVPHRVCYALKANASRAVLRVLAGLGAGADIVSGLELRAATAAGFTADRVVFSGVGKTDAEIALGVEQGVGAFNAESEAEIARIGAAASARGQRGARGPAREPRHRPPLAPLHLDRPAREQVRHRHRAGRGDPGARAVPGRRAYRRPAVPHRLADHRPRSAGGVGARAGGPLAAAAGAGPRAGDDRRRRRPGRGLRRLRRAHAGGVRGPRAARAARPSPHRPRRARAVAGGPRGRAPHPRPGRQGEPGAHVRGGGRGDERPAAARALRRLPSRGAGDPAGPAVGPGGRGGPGVRDRDFLARDRELEAVEPGSSWPCATPGPTGSPWPPPTTCGPGPRRSWWRAGGRGSRAAGRPSRTWSRPRSADPRAPSRSSRTAAAPSRPP